MGISGGYRVQEIPRTMLRSAFTTSSIYVNPRERTVIVKLSANSDYGRTNDDRSWRSHDHFALFRALAELE